MLLGALSHSGRFRGVFCEQMTFGHLAEAMHRVLVALGGTPRVWRTDRMATIVVPGTDRLTTDAAQAAKHYGVEVAVCPSRRAQRKGVVEAAVKYTTKSWWRSAPVTTMAEAQASLDAWCIEVGDQRKRPKGTVGQIGSAEPLRALPRAAYPAVIAVERRRLFSPQGPFYRPFGSKTFPNSAFWIRVWRLSRRRSRVRPVAPLFRRTCIAPAPFVVCSFGRRLIKRAP